MGMQPLPRLDITARRNGQEIFDFADWSALSAAWTGGSDKILRLLKVAPQPPLLCLVQSARLNLNMRKSIRPKGISEQAQQ